jgi:ribose 1,5-bisphosphokinase
MTGDCGLATHRFGRLILVVGASGVGKDTLLSHARAALSGDERYVFPRRVITRPVDATEDHIAATAAEFDRLIEAGAISFSWLAHGLRYALPRAIEADITAGRVVTCNVSRTIVGTARQRFTQVTVIEITAPVSVRCERLWRRGRESAKVIAARMARTVEDPVTAASDIKIDNSGAIGRSVATFVAALRAI